MNYSDPTALDHPRTSTRYAKPLVRPKGLQIKPLDTFWILKFCKL